MGYGDFYGVQGPPPEGGLRGVSLAGAGYMAGMGDLWVPHRIWQISWFSALFRVFRGFPRFSGVLTIFGVFSSF